MKRTRARGCRDVLGHAEPQRHCSKDCRIAFHRAARRWAEKAVVAGRLTVEELKDTDCTAYTLAGGPTSALRYGHPQPSPSTNARVAPRPALAVAGGSYVPEEEFEGIVTEWRGRIEHEFA